jgi:RND family efflux transporter MFP subunit
MKRLAVFSAVLVLLILAGVAAFQTASKRYGQRQANPGVPEQQAVPVTVSPVLRRHFSDEITAISTLRARETGFVSPKLPGKVEAVLVDVGSRVGAGELVVRLDRSTLDLGVQQARAAHSAAIAVAAQAKAGLERAEKEYRRASNLLAEKVIPQSRFEAAETAYKGAREAVVAAEEQARQAEAALQTAEEHLRDAEIRSPLGGVLVERSVEVGQSVAPGMALLRILDQSSLKAEFELPETDFGRVAVGMPVTVAVDSFAGQQFSGRVSVVNREMNLQTRTFRVRAEILNPGEKLAEGMFARVRLFRGKRAALAVPRDAIQRLPGSGTVYAFVVEGNQAAQRTIKVGAVEDEWAEVLEGLREQELVVTSGAGRLQSGALVKIAAAVTGGEPQAEGAR